MDGLLRIIFQIFNFRSNKLTVKTLFFFPSIKVNDIWTAKCRKKITPEASVIVIKFKVKLLMEQTANFVLMSRDTIYEFVIDSQNI